MEIVQAGDGLVDRAVVAVPLFEVGCGRVDGKVAEHRIQCLTGVVAEHFAGGHQYLAAVEVVEKRRELESVPAWPEVTLVEEGLLRAAPLPAGRHLVHVHRLHPGDGVAHQVDETCVRNDLSHPLRDPGKGGRHRVTRRALADCAGLAGAGE
jgi:hypothetical protein